jgi:peptidoglycan/xylan/chitin deacetylase (PgdA/CDA1 family)
MKELYFKLLHVLFINKLAHYIPGMVKPFVLCYHQIEIDEFEKQIITLKKKFEIIDLKTFITRLNQKKIGAYCTLTLDDCLNEDITKATAICRKHNIPITFFLPVRFSINKEALPGTWLQKLLEKRSEFFLNKEKIKITSKNRIEVKQLINSTFSASKFKIKEIDNKVRTFFAENNIKEEDIITDEYKVIGVNEVKVLSKEKNFNFQSHTLNHESLRLCTPEEIKREFSDSKNILEEITGKEIFAICYPYGSKEIIGDEIFNFVSDYYSCGLSFVHGICTKKTDIYFMPRIGIYPKDDLKKFLSKIYHNMLVSYFK